MSLVCWLPLNGNVNNQGLLSNPTISTTPTYVDGKLGKAMSTGALTLTAEQTNSVLNNKAVSFCFWIKVIGTDRRMIFGNGGMSANNNRKFAIFQYPTVNDLHLSWMNDTENNTFIATVLTGCFPDNIWTHCAITYENPICKVYINGEVKAEYNGASNSSTFAYSTPLIYNSSGRLLNDFRIYDHCLSPLEVKQISQGLVCHYKLSNQYETGQINKYSGSVAEGDLSTDNRFAKTKLENERGYNYKLTYTGNGNNRWPSMNAGSTFSFTIGKKYYYSCKVRCHSANFSFSLRAARSSNDWVTSSTNVLQRKDGEWHEYYVSQTINETYNRSGTTVTCNPILEFYSESLSTADKVYSADFDIKDIQVIESDCYVPFIDNNMVNSTVYDSSGYGNNGIRQGNIIWSDDSARYSGSYKFDGNQSLIKINNFNINPILTQEFTISFWINSNDAGDRSVYFGNYGFESTSQCFNIEKNASDKLRIYWGGNPDIVLNTFNIPDNEWCHIVITKTENTISAYKNGELNYSSTYNLGDLSVLNTYGVGRDNRTGATAFNGNLVDFRLYATALSESDIKQLYNVSASIDKSGILSAYEFVEEG